MHREAVYSNCGFFRYRLTRSWENNPDGYVLFIGLNPSPAKSKTEDKTIRRCIQFAKVWGFGEICVVNLFALRAEDPRALTEAYDPVGYENDTHIKECLAGATDIVPCWGSNGIYRDRHKEVNNMLQPYAEKLSCFGYTKNDQPKHPLYVPKDVNMQHYEIERSLNTRRLLYG